MRPGKTPVSCVPCAKRKVRCDKQQPCCNCKRRPQDECTYPALALALESPIRDPGQRIVELERYIRRLGGDPKDAFQASIRQCLPVLETSPVNDRPAVNNNEPAPPAEPQFPITSSGSPSNDEEGVFIESPMWCSWVGTEDQEDDGSATSFRRNCGPPSAAVTGYLPTILDTSKTADCNVLPLPVAHIHELWTIFLKNVHPFVSIFFSWEISSLIEKACDQNSQSAGLSDTERCLIWAIILMSVTSLSENECSLQLNAEKSRLLDQFQQATEKQLLLVKYAYTSNRLTLQAFMLYILSMMERAHPAALYSLMGIAVRTAERLGFHRDGQKLGLGAVRSEERRRVWWQLQYMEIALARFVGALPISLFGDWDAKMPANIEDEDLRPGMKTLPPERTKICTISQCLWAYEVLSFNRRLQQKTHGAKTLAWATSPQVSLTEKDAVIDQVEGVLRDKFLRYCELFNPQHLNIQIRVTQYILVARMLMRQPALVNARISEMSRSQRDEFLELCTKNLEYAYMCQTNEAIKGFVWHNQIYFPWVAFVYVILESHHRFDEHSATGLWNLIEKIYMAHPELRTNVHRKDINFAAHMTLASWRKHAVYIRNKRPTEPCQQPPWIMELCEHRGIANPESPLEADRSLEHEFDHFLGTDFDFDMIDWTSWDDSFMNTGLYSASSHT